MNISPERKGMLLFGLLLLGMLAISLIALQLTGSVGIEERFTSALGISSEKEEEGGAGFFIEGNIPAYGVILGGMILVCILLYRRR